MSGERTQRPRRGRRPTDEVSDPQRRTLAAIGAHIRRRGFPPSLHELGAELGIAAATVHEQVSQLVRKGYLRRDAGKARSLEVVRQVEERPAALVAVPIVGKVAAGPPMLAQENIIGELLIDSSVLRGGRGFALEVDGDSMIGADIRSGDYVIVRQQQVAESGDIVVALLGDEATVKRLHIGPDRIELRPENSRLRPISVGPDDDLRIQGRVVAVRRPPRSTASGRRRPSTA